MPTPPWRFLSTSGRDASGCRAGALVHPNAIPVASNAPASTPDGVGARRMRRYSPLAPRFPLVPPRRSGVSTASVRLRLRVGAD